MNINDYIRNLNVGLPEDILRRKIYGDFDGAIRLIDRRLARDDQPQALRDCLIAQKEIMRRLPLDYPLTRAEALALVRGHIADFTEEEFDERVDAGQIWWIYVNGELLLYTTSDDSAAGHHLAWVQEGDSWVSYEKKGFGTEAQSPFTNVNGMIKGVYMFHYSGTACSIDNLSISLINE